MPQGATGSGGTGSRRDWMLAALLSGIAYLLIGRLFSLPMRHVQAWRLAAWGASGAVYAAHFAFEHVRLRSTPLRLALHVAAGVALGGFALAVAGMLRSLAIDATLRPLWLLALVLFPAITGIPAWLGAWVAGVVLSRRSRQA